MNKKSEAITYDLTTAEGLAKAVEDYAKNDSAKIAILAVLQIINPLALPLFLLGVELH